MVTVAEDFPQHVDYALRDGVWDTTRHFRVQPDDDLFFYVTGPTGGLVARARAESPMRPLSAADPRPWDDGGLRDYNYRTRLREVSRHPLHTYSWSEMQALFGSGARPNHGVIEVKKQRGLRALRDAFRVDMVWPGDVADGATDQWVAEYPEFGGIDPNQEDRVRATQQVVVRRGQPAFRRALIQAYGRCLVTGSSVEVVLEAAHISPYKGAHTNDPRNGLLLRADIHTLFDLDLLTVLPDLTVRVAPSLSSSMYGGFDGDSLVLPAAPTLRPEPTLLALHNRNCTWL